MKYRLADKQRKIALKQAFKIIDAFIEPSYTPDIGSKYETVKKYLLKRYKKV